MGTNYYLHTDFCKYCGKPKKEVHLGKSSSGWKFLFHKTRQMFNFNSFCNFIEKGIIYDEYGNKCSSDDLLHLISIKQDEKHNPQSENINGYDFLDCDFC